jgi:hypothetical protein
MQEVRGLKLIIQIKVLTIYIFVTSCEKLIYYGKINPFFDSNFFHNINADEILCVPWLKELKLHKDYVGYMVPVENLSIYSLEIIAFLKSELSHHTSPLVFQKGFVVWRSLEQVHTLSGRLPASITSNIRC